MVVIRWSSASADDEARPKQSQATHGPHQSASPDIDPTDPPIDIERIATLITQIESGSFIERERATTALFRLGVDAIPELMRRTDSAGDGETRMRLSQVIARLSVENDAAMEQRFLAGGRETLPGWTSFVRWMGDSRSSRRLFVDIRRRFPDQVSSWDGSSRDRGRGMMVVVSELQRRAQRSEGAIGSHQLMCILIPLTDPQIDSSLKVDQAVLWSVQTGATRALLDQSGTHRGTTDLLSNWVRRSSRVLRESVMPVALMLQLEAGVEIAREVLANANAESVYAMRTALQLIAAGGNRTDVELVRPLMIDDREATGRVRRGGSFGTATIGDCAAAALVQIADLDAAEIGLQSAALDAQYGFSPELLALDDPATRQAIRESIETALETSLDR